MALTRLNIATDIENISNVKDQRILVNRSIQYSLERVFTFHDFPYYMQEKAIETTATYVTGTAKVTQGSPTVTGVGTAWTSVMVGRKFRHSNENPYYRIKTVGGATSITLEQNYQGDTDSTGSTYTIYKDEYRLAPDVDKYKTLRQIQNNVPIISFHPTRFDEMYPAPQSYSDPLFEIMSGTKLDTYTTGTISATGTTITGTSTTWLSVEGLGRMSVIRIGNNIYTVKSVDSDIQLTTYETVTTASDGTDYEIQMNNLVVQLYQIPNAQRLIYYRYFRQPHPLAQDYDIPDMPFAFHYILVYGSLAIMLLQKGDINKAQQEAEARFIEGLNQMKLKLGSFTPDRIWHRRSVDRISRLGMMDGLEASNFDRRYSSP